MDERVSPPVDRSADAPLTWEWCPVCDNWMLRCPKCHNNCCNGTYGFVDGVECNLCPCVYLIQGFYLEQDLQPAPETPMSSHSTPFLAGDVVKFGTNYRTHVLKESISEPSDVELVITICGIARQRFEVLLQHSDSGPTCGTCIRLSRPPAVRANNQ